MKQLALVGFFRERNCFLTVRNTIQSKMLEGDKNTKGKNNAEFKISEDIERNEDCYTHNAKNNNERLSNVKNKEEYIIIYDKYKIFESSMTLIGNSVINALINKAEN